MTNPPPYSRPRNAIANIIFASRWLQLPIYLGLIVVQLIYAYKFMKGLKWTPSPTAPSCSPC